MRRGIGCLAVLYACGGSGGPSEPPPGQATVGTVRGRVLAAADSGVNGVAISLLRSGHGPRSATTNASGTYTATNLATGSWTVEATPIAGYEANGSLTTTVLVLEGETVDAPVLRLRRISTNPPPSLALVSITDNQFTPASVTVAVNGTVRWTNNGTAQHNTTAAGQWASPNLSSSGVYERSFPTAGTFNYQCTLHAGMSGTVVVQ